MQINNLSVHLTQSFPFDSYVFEAQADDTLEAEENLLDSAGLPQFDHERSPALFIKDTWMGRRAASSGTSVGRVILLHACFSLESGHDEMDSGHACTLY